MRVTKKFTAVLAAGTLAVALSACGGDEPAAPAAGDAAAEADVKPAASIGELTALIEASQAKATSGHMEMTYGGELAQAAGLTESTTSADFAMGESGKATDGSMKMTMTIMGMDVELLLVEGTMYMDMGELTQGKFLELSPEDLADDPDLAGALDSMESMDVAGQAKALEEAVTSFEHTGTETVDGVDLDVYTLEIDPQKLQGGAAGVDAETAAQVGTMTVVYKLDPQGLPVESDVVLTIDGQEMTMDMDFSNWGEPVTIEAPPADKVMPYSELAGS